MASRPQRRFRWFSKRPETIDETKDCEFQNVVARQHALDTAAVDDEVSTLTMMMDVDHRPTCRTIDEAMQALSDGCCENVADFQALAPQYYDWILDGHVSFSQEKERSQRLMEELKGPNLDDLMGQLKEEEIENEETIDENRESKASEEEDDDEFGDFQMAQPTQTGAQDNNKEAFSDTNNNDCDENIENKFEECRLKEGDKDDDNQEEEGTLGDVPREIFNAPLPVDRALLLYQEDDTTAERILHDTIEDLSSPEGRFIRRLQIGLCDESDDDDDEHDFNLAEFNTDNPEWDSTLQVLRNMPWEHVPILHDDVDPSIVQDYITQRLSQVDASFAICKSLLHKRAYTKSRTIKMGNSVIHEMHHNLSMAEMYIERSQESIAQARGSEQDCTGVIGATVLLHEFDKRDDYLGLQQLLDKIHALLKQEYELNESVRSFATDGTISHRLILKRAKLLNQTVYEDEDLSRLECLDDLRLRANQVLDVFRNEIESTLCSYIDKICYNWSICSDAEYKRLFQAMFAVHNVQLCNGQLEILDESPSHAVETWSKCILDTLLFQADKCFARALLDPTDSLDSDFDQELITLGQELKQDSRDAVKLISLTHNLVTIRFDFEVNCSYLPMVYHRLCALLTEVLHAHCILSQHHKALMVANGENDSNDLKQIEDAIRSSKVDIWRRCEQVLAKCLDQYHHFAAKKTLFSRESNDDGMTWAEDLEGLHDVLRLTQQFLSLGHEFLDTDQMESAQVTSLKDFNSKSELRKKLCEVFRRHLRSIHIESMTLLGASLFNESWRLVSLRDCRSMADLTVRDDGQHRRQRMQEYLLSAVRACSVSPAEMKARYWQNALCTQSNGESRDVFGTIKTSGNPFLLKTSASTIETSYINVSRVSLDNNESSRKPMRQGSLSSDDENASKVYSTLCELIDNEHAAVPVIATESMNSVLLKWTCRLLTVMFKLPLVIDDAAKIIQDLCDLYFITAFRLCAGNGKNEKLILGIDPVDPIISQEELDQGLRSPRTSSKKEASGFMARLSGSSSTGQHRRGSGRDPKSPAVLLRNVEAEVCAPLLSTIADVSMLRDFIISGQVNLENVVKLDKLEQRLKDPPHQSATEAEYIVELVHTLKKRQACAWSCLLVAAILDVMRGNIETVLTVSFLDEMLGVTGSQATAEHEETLSVFDSITSYSKVVVDVVPHLVNICSRIACLHVIHGRRVVNEIISASSVWEESGLNEQANDYVDDLCDRFARIWFSLSSPPPAMPRGILEVTWEHICEGGFLSLLEGFSRVPYCSTEGRSLMSMDLAAFADGIDAASIIHRLDSDKLVSAPPLVTPRRGMRYIDMYIKVFYYPEEDVMKWIASNYADYQLNHMLALLICGSCDRDNNSTNNKKLAASIQALYKMDIACSGEESGEGSGQRTE